jgi:hypothetical protein
MLFLCSCVSPQINDLVTVPELVCPCDPVRVRAVAANTRTDTLTLDPPVPGTPVLGTWPNDDQHVYEHSFPICESTNVIYEARRGSDSVTRVARVEVVRDRYPVPLGFGPVCDGDIFRGFRPTEIDPNRFAPSLLVQRVTNDSDREIQLTHNGVTASAPPRGEYPPLFVGMAFAGRWTAVSTTLITPSTRESCAGTGDVRMTGPLPPGTIRDVAIPTLTVTVYIGCPPR